MELNRRVNIDVTTQGLVSSRYRTHVLKPNLVDGENILTQEAIDACGENSKLVIKYDFNLNGQTIRICDNTIVDFDGGCFYNGTVVWNDTLIINICALKVFEDIVHQGTKATFTGVVTDVVISG